MNNFSLCSSDSVISVVLSPSSLILFSACWYLLLTPCSKLFTPEIVFLNCRICLVSFYYYFPFVSFLILFAYNFPDIFYFFNVFFLTFRSYIRVKVLSSKSDVWASSETVSVSVFYSFNEPCFPVSLYTLWLFLKIGYLIIIMC